jgi:hypothetical protein
MKGCFVAKVFSNPLMGGWMLRKLLYLKFDADNTTRVKVFPSKPRKKPNARRQFNGPSSLLLVLADRRHKFNHLRAEINLLPLKQTKNFTSNLERTTNTLYYFSRKTKPDLLLEDQVVRLLFFSNNSLTIKEIKK